MVVMVSIDVVHRRFDSIVPSCDPVEIMAVNGVIFGKERVFVVTIFEVCVSFPLFEALSALGHVGCGPPVAAH